jgi:GT2 family glycosyltransferase
MTSVDVVLPTWNRADEALRAARAVLASRGVRVDLVVVDDGSSDGTGARLAAEGLRVEALPQNRGAAAARNAGARLGTAGVLVFVDSDVLVGPDDLARLVAHLEADATLGAMVAVPGPPEDGGISAAEAHFLARIHHNYLRLPARIGHTNTTLVAVRRAAFEAVGGFNERTRGVEDDELGFDLVRAGWQVGLARDVVVRHAKSLTLPGLLRSDFERTVDRVLYMLRTRQARSAAQEGRFISTPARQALAALAAPAPALVWALHADYLAWLARAYGPRLAARVALVLAVDMPVVHAGLWAGAAMWAAGRRYR